MTCFANDLHGAALPDPDPDTATLQALLAWVDAVEAEHGDVSLKDADGGSLSYSDSRFLILENAETDDGPWHLAGVAPQQALALWECLAGGDWPTLRAQAWAPGHAPWSSAWTPWSGWCAWRRPTG